MVRAVLMLVFLHLNNPIANMGPPGIHTQKGCNLKPRLRDGERFRGGDKFEGRGQFGGGGGGGGGGSGLRYTRTNSNLVSQKLVYHVVSV